MRRAERSTRLGQKGRVLIAGKGAVIALCEGAPEVIAARLGRANVGAACFFVHLGKGNIY